MYCNTGGPVCRYPNTTRKILEGVSIAVTLNSRVAVIGANGAGKSTMIKLLTGELETAEGTVWKHPNLRVAYVAQHAFHHIEQHLDKTPNDYIAWRYASGEDREAQEKASAQVSCLSCWRLLFCLLCFQQAYGFMFAAVSASWWSQPVGAALLTVACCYVMLDLPQQIGSCNQLFVVNHTVLFRKYY